MDPELQHKTEVERNRNKQRQRDQMFQATPVPQSSGTATPKSLGISWRREQDKIDSVLDPVNSGRSVPKYEFF